MNTNSSLLMYQGIVADRQIHGMLLMLSIILILIIMGGSIALIYNSFAISVTDRLSDFGMLASIGATKKQRRKIVLLEAALIGCISIPIGMLCGFGGIAVTFKFISPLLRSIIPSSAQLTLVILPSAVFVAILFSAGTILVSAWMPAKRAAKIAPIMAIRKSNEIKINPKISKSGSLIQRLFGMEGSLALKNIKRNKKRYRITLFSLIISFILFICSCSFMMYLKNAYLMQADHYNSDVALAVNGDASCYDQTQQILSEALVLSDMTAASYYTTTKLTASVPTNWLTAAAAKLIVEDAPASQTAKLSITLIALDNDSFTKFIQVNDISYPDDTADSLPAIVCNSYTYQDAHSFQKLQTFAVNDEQTIDLYRNVSSADDIDDTDTDDTDATESIFTLPVTLTAFSDTSCIGVQTRIFSPDTVYLVVPLDAYEQHVLPLLHETEEISTMIEYMTLDHTALSDSLDRLIQDHELLDLTMYSMDYQSLKDSSQKLIIIMNIFIFGFVTLILAVSLTNIYNTISTSLHLRKQEFAMIRSVGMSPRSFHRMLRFESLFYAFFALVIGIPVSLGISYLIYDTMKDNFDSSFLVPWIPIIAGSAGLTAILYVVMQLSAHQIKKASIVDNLRNVNQ